MPVTPQVKKLLKKLAYDQYGGAALVDQVDEVSEAVQNFKDDLKSVSEETVATLKEIAKSVKENKPVSIEGISQIKGEKGDTGDTGKDGQSIVGPAGKDGISGKDGKDGERGPKGYRGESIVGPQGLNGKDGSPDTPEQIAEKLNTLEEVIDATVIKGHKNFIDKKTFEKSFNTVYTKGQIDQRWHGGGLSSVATDATLTGSGTTASPLSVVGGGVHYEAPVGAIDGVNRTYTVTHSPKAIILRNLTYFEADGSFSTTGSGPYTVILIEDLTPQIDPSTSEADSLWSQY